MTETAMLETCRKCNVKLIPTAEYNEWWKTCPECKEFVFLYEPMPHQLRYHQDPAKFKLFAGGFGSSKTVTVAAEFVMLALNTPHGVGLVGAATYNQLERTSKKQVMDMIPKEFVESMSKKDNVMTLTNGYEIIFRSLDDEQKLRSLNLCHVIMEEANGVDFSIFTQLQTRLRHKATDDHKILLSSNPDINWIRSEILMKSNKIYGASEKYSRKIEEINPNISTHVSKSEQNIHLPKDYISDMRVGKPEWWVARFLDGSFSFSDGSVYPNFVKNIVHDISPDQVRNNIRKKGWKVVGAADFGLIDPTTLLLAAIDPIDGVAYVYDEYYKNQLPVSHHAREMKRKMEHVPLGALMGLYGDPSGGRRNINDRRSIFDHYAEHNVHFQKADNRIDAGIMKVYSYLEMGKLKILGHLVETIDEMTNYRYKTIEMGETPDEKPVGVDDHMPDTMRYLIQTLPDDPNALKSVSYGYEDHVHKNSDAHLPYELQSDDGVANYLGNNAWMNY